MRILDFDSGVEMWKVTPSKSDTVWSMETGDALLHFVSYKGIVLGMIATYPEKRSVRTD